MAILGERSSYMKIKLLDYGGRMPERAHYNDAGADVFSPKDYRVYPGQLVVVPLGFGLALPDGWAGFVFSRTSTSASGLVCDLPPIDSGYTGEVHAFLRNVSQETYYIKEGDRIGQLVILPVLAADFSFDLGSERTDGAFGSSGR